MTAKERKYCDKSGVWPNLRSWFNTRFSFQLGSK